MNGWLFQTLRYHLFMNCGVYCVFISPYHNILHLKKDQNKNKQGRLIEATQENVFF